MSDKGSQAATGATRKPGSTGADPADGPLTESVDDLIDARRNLSGNPAVKPAAEPIAEPADDD